MFSKNVVKDGASVEVTASQTEYNVVGSGTTDCFNIEHSTAFIMDAVCSGVTDSWPASATLNLTADITLTSVAEGAARNTTTFTTEVLAAAANPTDTVLAEFTGTSAAIVCTITPNDGTNNPGDAATATLNLNADIILTSVAAGAARNTNTLTLEVAAAAANPTDTVLAEFTGSAAAITLTITPNDGTNNGAVAVDLTTAEIVELINTGSVTGKTVTVTDVSSRRILQTATGGDSTPVADGGEGDGVLATFSGGTDITVDLTTEELVELINTGSVTGKTVTVTDASSLRILQTAEGGDATPLANGGEGDSVLGTFSGGKSAGTGTLKLQVRFSKDQDWIDTKSATVTADGIFTIKFLDTVAADQQYLPLRPQGRLVATTTSSDAFTVDAVYIQA